MVVQSTFAAAAALSFGVLVNARASPPDDGYLGASTSQSCDDNVIAANANGGYPQCRIFQTQNVFANRGFSTSKNNGYNVWWNSGDPNPGCKIIVRAPASQDLPACGNYLRGWDTGGCYYTLIDNDTFNLQFCCGTGDCNAASPAASIDDARARMIQGETTSVSMDFDDGAFKTEADSGTKDLGDGIEMRWERRNPSSMTQVARDALAADAGSDAASLEDRSLEKRRCKKYTESRRYTKGGRQTKISPTKNCDIPNGCPITIESSLTTGRSTSVSVGFNIFDLFMASTDITFSKSKERSLSESYNQAGGTRGYVTFTPTFICTDGKVDDCGNSRGISDGDDASGCTPKILPSGQNDGELLFVYE